MVSSRRGFLTPTGGNGDGLLAEYKSNGTARAVQQVDPQVDFSSYTGSAIAPVHREQAQLLSANIETRLSSEQELAALFYPSAEWTSSLPLVCEFMSSQQERRLAQTITQQPDRVSGLTWSNVVDFYRTFRIAAPDDAVQLVGTWAQQHALAAPVFANDFTGENRLPYRELANLIVHQYPEHEHVLMDNYLSVPGDGCNLTIAYILAFTHHAKGEMTKWVAFVDGKRSAKDLGGDAQAQWLVARAMTEEIRRVRYKKTRLPRVRAFAGQQWLEEARLVADSEEIRTHAIRELVVRYASQGLFDRATELAAEVRGGGVEQWSKEIARLRSEGLHKLEYRQRVIAEAERKRQRLREAQQLAEIR